MMKFTVAIAAAASFAFAQPLESRGFSGGELTFYEGGLTACGTPLNTKSDYGLAVSFNVFDTFPGAGPNPNRNPICNTKVRATHKETGVTLEIPVVDKCQGCKDADLDVTERVFKDFGFDLGRGRVAGLEWDFIGSGGDDGGNGGSPTTTTKKEPTTTSTKTTSKPPPSTTTTTTQEPETTTTSTTTSADEPTTTPLLPVGNVGDNPSPSDEESDIPPSDTEVSEEPEETEAPSETEVEEPSQTQVEEPQETETENPTTLPTSSCIETWTACNESFDGTAEAIKNYKCHTEYVQCRDAELKASQGVSAKRMHRKRMVGLSQASF